MDAKYYGYTKKNVIVVHAGTNFASTEAMTAVAMTSRVFSGVERNDSKLRGGADLLSASLPTWGNGPDGKNQIDFYYWYYGTLAMYQMGGDHWKKWNAAMQPYLLSKQLKGNPRELGGSWDPQGYNPMKAGGRVLSTSLSVLSLEVYYRYLPMYQDSR